MRTKMMIILAIAGLLTLGMMQPPLSIAAEGDNAALLKLIPSSKQTIAGAIRNTVKSPEVAISAKFELDDKGQLSLSIYTAEKGLGNDAEHNVLKELSGSPEQEEWKPEVEVFKDVEHISRAAGQQTLMALSPLSLLNVIGKAEKQGMVFSITPVVSDHKAQFIVLVSAKNKVVELRYDLKTGAVIKNSGTR